MTICTEQCYKPRSHWEHFLYSSVVMIACFRVKCFLPEGGEKVNFLLMVHSNTIQQGEFEIEKTVFPITNIQYLWDFGKLTLGLNFLIFILKYFSGLRWEMTENNVYKVKSLVLPHSKHWLNIGFLGYS